MQATWWQQKSPGVLYWRCEVPSRHLPGQRLELDFGDIQPGDDEDHKSFPRQQGVAIWQHPANRTRALMMMAMRQNGIKVLVEVDDNYLEDPPFLNAEWREGLNVDDYASREGHRVCLRYCDGVIVSTEHLAKQYRKAVDVPVYVCPNSVDPADWDDLDKTDDGILRIGWAASASHAVDASLVKRALEWASRQSAVEVVLLGLRPHDWKFPVTVVPWTDTLADYRRSLQILDVGVCPLKPTLWANGKSDIKALEYAMAGAMSICSDVEPYKAWRDQPALMASSNNDFARAVRWCVSHRDEVKQYAVAARAYALQERTIQSSIWKWKEAVND